MLATLETAIIAELDGSDLGALVSTERYGKEASVLIDDIQDGEGKLPVSYLVYEGSSGFEYFLVGTHRETLRFKIVLADTDLRGSEQQAGIYALIEAAKISILMKSISGTSSALKLESIQAEIINEFVAIYSVSFTTTVDA